jgi:hypothetical protein
MTSPLSLSRRALGLALLLAGQSAAALAGLLPAEWNPKAKADAVLAGLTTVTAPQVKGAHDAELVIADGKAYIVAEVSDLRAGEAAAWPEIYVALSIVDVATQAVEIVIPVAQGGQRFANTTLPEGACFVPRILALTPTTLRVYFASERPGQRQSQTWYRDFDLRTRTFADELHRVRLKTAAGVQDFQPHHFHADAARAGFRKPEADYGFYVFDSFKSFDGRLHAALNNFVGKQNALAVLNDARDTFEILGHFNEPQALELSESAVNRLPDGTWLAIIRQDGGNKNYHFATSHDGRAWTEARELPFVRNGTNSKPTFDRIGDVYYLGWQDAAQVNGASRSVFNVDVSRDGRTWERKYRFESEKSFQYPTFREYQGAVYVVATQGDHSPSRKERIVFGKLEDLR